MQPEIVPVKCKPTYDVLTRWWADKRVGVGANKDALRVVTSQQEEATAAIWELCTAVTHHGAPTPWYTWHQHRIVILQWESRKSRGYAAVDSSAVWCFANANAWYRRAGTRYRHTSTGTRRGCSRQTLTTFAATPLSQTPLNWDARTMMETKCWRFSVVFTYLFLMHCQSI